MSSTKIRAPRTLLTLPSAWSSHGSPSKRVSLPTLALGQLSADDREALVIHGEREAGRDPEVRRRRARRVGPGAPLRVRLDRGEAATREVVADRLDERARMARPRASAAVVAMQVITAGSGASGSCG